MAAGRHLQEFVSSLCDVSPQLGGGELAVFGPLAALGEQEAQLCGEAAREVDLLRGLACGGEELEGEACVKVTVNVRLGQHGVPHVPPHRVGLESLGLLLLMNELIKVLERLPWRTRRGAA